MLKICCSEFVLGQHSMQSVFSIKQDHGAIWIFLFGRFSSICCQLCMCMQWAAPQNPKSRPWICTPVQCTRNQGELTWRTSFHCSSEAARTQTTGLWGESLYSVTVNKPSICWGLRYFHTWTMKVRNIWISINKNRKSADVFLILRLV